MSYELGLIQELRHVMLCTRGEVQMSRTADDQRSVLQEAEIKARNDFTLQAMHQQFERLNLQLQEMRDTIADQNDTIAELRRKNNVRPQARRNVPHAPIVNQENPIDDFNDIDFCTVGIDRRGQRGRVEDDNISSIKIKMPSFKGTRDPDLYLGVSPLICGYCVHRRLLSCCARLASYLARLSIGSRRHIGRRGEEEKRSRKKKITANKKKRNKK